MAGQLFLGADTGGTGIKFVVCRADGKIVDQGEVPTDPDSIPISMERLSCAVAQYHSKLQAVGMGCAGIIDPVNGTVGRSPNLPGWQNSPLRDLISQAFLGKPVFLANDVNGALFGEFRQGAGRGCQNLVMIALGTGVGGGIVLGGQLLTGSRHGAGEIGHNILDPNGPLCSCGNHGCLEAYAGSRGLLIHARQVADELPPGNLFKIELAEIGDSLTTEHLSQLAEKGIAEALEVFAWAGIRLGQAVGNLINTLDPDRIIIGGGVAKAGDFILGPCRRVYPDLVLSEEAKNTPVVVAELGNQAASVGAAWLARESLMTGDPRI